MDISALEIVGFKGLIEDLTVKSLAFPLQAVQAAQITFEDFFLSSMDISAFKIVGFEGVWGSLAMFLVMLPIVQHVPGAEGSGIHENSLDTWHVRVGTFFCDA